MKKFIPIEYYAPIWYLNVFHIGTTDVTKLSVKNFDVFFQIVPYKTYSFLNVLLFFIY